MPLVYQQNINLTTKLGVWHIGETEEFFLLKVPLQREITHPHKRLQHLAARYLLKELYPEFPYALIRIADTKKPFLENEAYHFSISHCGHYAAVIVSTSSRVGVDVEMITAKVHKVKHKFLSEQELQMITNIMDKELAGAGSGDDIFNFQFSNISDQLTTVAWSVKESMFKWQGSSEVDFKEHLQIQNILSGENEGIAHCKYLKDTSIDLQVHYLLFNNNCISWVICDEKINHLHI